MPRIRIMALGLMAAAMAAEPAFAHHSFQMFDLEKRIPITGTVKEFQWTNPHSFVELMVVDAAGKEHQWSFETQAPGVLRRRGWRYNSIMPGDKITVEMSPLKSGEYGGYLRSLTRADGKVLKPTG
jgi:hypothetical protein